MRRLSTMVAVVLAINLGVAIGVVRMSSSPAFFLISLALASTLVILGLVRRDRLVISFRTAAVLEFLLGLIGLFSIGLPLVVASILLLSAADRGRPVPANRRAPSA